MQGKAPGIDMGKKSRYFDTLAAEGPAEALLFMNS
jgi:hypothetical protein